jgi:hypothetical protein
MQQSQFASILRAELVKIIELKVEFLETGICRKWTSWIFVCAFYILYHSYDKMRYVEYIIIVEKSVYGFVINFN